MTERALGSNFKWFVGKVVNRGDGKEGKKDVTESGRTQIRIFGKHDDEKNVPNEKLPWAVPLLPIGGPLTGAGREGVGTTPIGLKKGTIVVGFYADAEESIPIIFGILTRSGADAGNDGEEVTPEKNDLPKGSRTAQTQGSDQNDVSSKRMTEDTAKEDQLHVSKPTIGSSQFDGSDIHNTINKVDPGNVAGALVSALPSMKGMMNVLGVSGSLLNNFQKIASGKMDLNTLVSLAGTAAKLASTAQSVSHATNQISSISNRIPSTPLSQISLATQMVNSGRYNTQNKQDLLTSIARNPAIALNIIKTVIGTEQMLASAFSGGNPIEGILGALGGAKGLANLAGGAQSLLGPLTGSFGAAIAVAGMMKGLGESAFAGNKSIPIPKIPGMPRINLPNSNISNILGSIQSVSNIASVVANISGSQAAAGFANQLNGAAVLSGAFLNSSISVNGVTSLAQVAAINRANGRNLVSVSTAPPVPPSRGVAPRVRSSTIIPNTNISNPNYAINSLKNSSITVKLPDSLTINGIKSTLNKNAGVGYNVTGSVNRVIGTK